MSNLATYGYGLSGYEALGPTSYGFGIGTLVTGEGVVTVTVRGDWNVAALSGDEVGTVWNVRFLVGDEEVASWNVHQSVTDEIQTLWDVEAQELVAQTSEILWSVEEFINQSVQGLWNTLDAVGEEVEAPWQVYVLAGKETDVLWQVADLAAQQMGVEWDVATFVGGETDVEWSVRTLTGKDVSGLWDVALGGGVGKSVQVLWTNKFSVLFDTITVLLVRAHPYRTLFTYPQVSTVALKMADSFEVEVEVGNDYAVALTQTGGGFDVEMTMEVED